jgi:hypothetical protein
MSEPYLKFLFNHSSVDAPYDFYTGSTGGSNWLQITPGSDKAVFTGGGIDDWSPFLIGDTAQMTLASGSRSPTIRPSVTSYIIPHVFVENSTTMYRVPSASQLGSPNTKAYAFAVSVSGTINGTLYMEAWDDYSFSTFSLPVLSGTANSGYDSYVNAINTDIAKDANGGVMPYPWTGATAGAKFLRGDEHRVSFIGAATEYITNEVFFYNMYIRLETDSPTFSNIPVIGFRYTYS